MTLGRRIQSKEPTSGTQIREVLERRDLLLRARSGLAGAPPFGVDVLTGQPACAMNRNGSRAIGTWLALGRVFTHIVGGIAGSATKICRRAVDSPLLADFAVVEAVNHETVPLADRS